MRDPFSLLPRLRWQVAQACQSFCSSLEKGSTSHLISSSWKSWKGRNIVPCLQIMWLKLTQEKELAQGHTTKKGQFKISKAVPPSPGSLIILLVRVRSLLAYERKTGVPWKIRGRSVRSLRPGAGDTLALGASSSLILFVSCTHKADGLFPLSGEQGYPRFLSCQAQNSCLPLSLKVPSSWEPFQMARLGLCVLLSHCTGLSSKLHPSVVTWWIYDSSMRL